MSWSSKDQTWHITKYTDLRFPSNNPIILENDLKLFIKKSAKLLVLAQGTRTLHQVPLREPHPVIKFRDLSFYVSWKIKQRDIRFRFRAKCMADSEDITYAISQFTHVQQHKSKTRGESQESSRNHSISPFSQETVKFSSNDSYDGFGSTSSNESMCSQRCTESFTPPYINATECVADYGTLSDVSPHDSYGMTSDRGSQTDMVPNYSAMDANELEHHLRKLLDSPSFMNLVANTKIALGKINKGETNRGTTKPKRRGKTAGTRSSRADSILTRF